MAAIPSSGSLVATHDYYRRRLGSTSSNSSCGSAEYPGEGIPRHPGERRSTPGCPHDWRGWQHRDLTLLLSGLPRADPGHWWASFFFGKSTLPFMATVLESPEHSEPAQASTGMITCDLAREAVGKQQPGGQPGQTNSRPP
uniref:Pancreatic progenitor cell differentiation and proliferation factor n=1 Tax=Monodon monoceros TaxID=40151 RepID=A0A8C6F0Q7_MONMO